MLGVPLHSKISAKPRGPIANYMQNGEPPRSKIQAPKDRGFFGRFKGFSPMRFENAGDYGPGGAIYALGAALAGAGSGDPGMTADLMASRKRDVSTQRENQRKRELTEAAARSIGQSQSRPPNQTPNPKGLFGKSAHVAMGGKYGEENMGWVERLGRGADGMNAYRDQMRQQQMIDDASTFDFTALARLDPFAAAKLKRQMERDSVQDVRYDREYADSRYDRFTDVNHRDRTFARQSDWRAEDHERADRRHQIQDGFTERGLDLQERGLNARIAADTAANEQPNFDDESKLRKEFLAQNKPFQEVQRAYERIKSTDATTSVGQVGLIFQIMKMYDPQSTVREGEFATAEQTTGIPGQFVNAYNKAISGNLLNPTQVKEFEKAADNLYGAAASEFDRSYEWYRTNAESYNLSAGRTVPNLRNPAYQGEAVRIKDDADYDALPSGAQYIGPDNQTRIKP